MNGADITFARALTAGAAVLREYDPDQPRDPDGRWTKVMYHVTGRRNRASIDADGLRLSDTASRYVWVTDDPAVANDLATKSWGGSRGDNDIWEVDVTGLNLAPDPHPGGSDPPLAGHSFILDQPVPRDRVRRAGTPPGGRWHDALGIPAPLYLVGGAVRDPLMGHPVEDEDYIALLPPEQIKAALKRAGHDAHDLTVRDRLVGVRATAGRLPLGGIEVAPPRVEVSTGPGRHDFDIVPHPHITTTPARDLLAADAARRDFTFNALYADKHGRVIDPTGRGVEDARTRTLRTISAESFRDDPLRILRGLRFVSTRGATPDTATREQMAAHADAVTALTRKGVSGTARTELNKMLMGDNVGAALRLARDTGVLAQFLPELRPLIGYQQQSDYHDLTGDEHTITALEAAAAAGASLRVRLALLFHDVGKPESAWEGADGRLHFYGGRGKEAHEVISVRVATAALTRLGYDTATIAAVAKIIGGHMLSPTTRVSKIRKLRREYGDDLLADLFAHRRADFAGKGTTTSAARAIAELDQMQALAVASRTAGDAVTRRALRIDGRDLIALGLRGRAVGEVLDALLQDVLAQPQLNDRDWLLQRVATLARKHGSAVTTRGHG